jgi:hypothetical protein
MMNGEMDNTKSIKHQASLVLGNGDRFWTSGDRAGLVPSIVNVGFFYRHGVQSSAD